MVLEPAEDANGGERGLIAINWVPDGHIKNFKATADSYKAIGIAARHGRTKKGIPKPTQSSPLIPERDKLIRAIEALGAPAKRGPGRPPKSAKVSATAVKKTAKKARKKREFSEQQRGAQTLRMKTYWSKRGENRVQEEVDCRVWGL